MEIATMKKHVPAVTSVSEIFRTKLRDTPQGLSFDSYGIPLFKNQARILRKAEAAAMLDNSGCTGSNSGCGNGGCSGSNSSC